MVNKIQMRKENHFETDRFRSSLSDDKYLYATWWNRHWSRTLLCYAGSSLRLYGWLSDDFVSERESSTNVERSIRLETISWWFVWSFDVLQRTKNRLIRKKIDSFLFSDSSEWSVAIEYPREDCWRLYKRTSRVKAASNTNVANRNNFLFSYLRR